MSRAALNAPDGKWNWSSGHAQDQKGFRLSRRIFDRYPQREMEDGDSEQAEASADALRRVASGHSGAERQGADRTAARSLCGRLCEARARRRRVAILPYQAR